jgi:hypothetical protein
VGAPPGRTGTNRDDRRTRPHVRRRHARRGHGRAPDDDTPDEDTADEDTADEDTADEDTADLLRAEPRTTRVDPHGTSARMPRPAEPGTHR